MADSPATPLRTGPRPCDQDDPPDDDCGTVFRSLPRVLLPGVCPAPPLGFNVVLLGVVLRSLPFRLLPGVVWDCLRWLLLERWLDPEDDADDDVDPADDGDKGAPPDEVVGAGICACTSIEDPIATATTAPADTTDFANGIKHSFVVACSGYVTLR